MELLYVWVEDYKNIHHQSFNFSNEYRFAFIPTEFETIIEANGEERKTLKGGTLDIKDLFPKLKEEKDKPFHNFFKPSQKVRDAWKANHPNQEIGRIHNITGIVGKNGVGKSNLLEFLRYSSFIYGGTRKIIVYKEGGKLYYAAINSPINQLINSNEFFIAIRKHSNIKIEYKNEYFATQIFYSNQVNFQRNDFSMGNSLISISRNSSLNNNTSTILEIHNTDFEFNLHFINHLDKLDITMPFKLPFEIDIEISIYKNLNNDSRDQYSDKRKELLDNFVEFHSIGREIFSTIDGNLESFIFILKYKHVERIIDYALTKIRDEKDIEILCNLSSRFLNSKDDFNSNFENFSRESEIVTLLNISSNFEEFISQIMSKWRYVFPNFGKLSKIYSTNAIFGINMSINISEFTIIWESYKKTNWDYFSFSWRGISSGEESILNLYSRFYSTTSKDNVRFQTLHELENSFKQINEEYKIQNLLILIDEGETGFHPEWQRTYLKNLIDFFPQIYPDKQIQIILTTHSPFLISDLPKDNIIFLDKGKKGTEQEGKCIVVDGLSKEKTFGANIHTLLSDSFFLQDGLMGEFAKRKINEILDFHKRVKRYDRILSKNEALKNKFKNNRNKNNTRKSSNEKILNRINNFWKVQKIIGEEYLSQIIKNHLEELDLILLGKKQAEEKAKKQELERILEKYGIEEIQNFHKDLKRNDKDNL